MKQAEINHAAQEDGIRLGLSRADVEASNFGAHTVRGIKALFEQQKHDIDPRFKDYAPEEDVKWAFNKLKGLDAPQVDGLLLGLYTWQVKRDDFGQHTVDGLTALIKNEKNLSLKDAYKQIGGRDAQEVAKLITQDRTKQAAKEGYLWVERVNTPSPGKDNGAQR